MNTATMSENVPGNVMQVSITTLHLLTTTQVEFWGEYCCHHLRVQVLRWWAYVGSGVISVADTSCVGDTYGGGDVDAVSSRCVILDLESSRVEYTQWKSVRNMNI